MGGWGVKGGGGGGLWGGPLPPRDPELLEAPKARWRPAARATLPQWPHPWDGGCAMRFRGRAVRGAHAVCVCWGDFVDLPPYSTVKCMRFQAVTGIAIAHTAILPPQFRPCLFHGQRFA